MSIAEPSVAVAGEALVDFVEEPDGSVTPHLGGGAYNAARTLGRLGMSPLYVGRLSRDRYGVALRAGLEQSGVRTDCVVTTDDPTTYAQAALDALGVASYRFVLRGTSSPGLTHDEAARAMRHDLAALHVGGLGLVLDPQASAIAQMVNDAGPRTLVLLDPNCRPGAVDDPDAYRRRLWDVIARADVVKASEEDLAYLEPGRTPARVARGMLECGPSLVLVTLGSVGALVLSAEREALVEAAPAVVLDTIGAGDAFGAAWVAAWASMGLRAPRPSDFDAAVRAARCAAVVAARTCERAGADPPDASELGTQCVLPPPARHTVTTGG